MPTLLLIANDLPARLQPLTQANSKDWSRAAEQQWVARFDLDPASGVHLLLFVTNWLLPPCQAAQTPGLLVPEASKQQVCVCYHTIDSLAGRSTGAWVTVIYRSAAARLERAGFPRPSLTAAQAPTVTNLHREGGGGELFFIVFAINGLKVCVSLFLLPFSLSSPSFFCRG